MNYFTNIKLGFKYRKCDKRSIITESMKIVVWRYKYLTVEIAKYRAPSYLIVYLDKTWFDSRDTKKIWTDS